MFLDKIHSTLCDLLDEIAVEHAKCERVPARQEQLALSAIVAS